MKTLTFIAITLFSGAIAGTLLGLINQVVVEPFIDKAIGIQTQRTVNVGEIIDPAQQTHYRMWQKGGEVVASTIYGISLSALFGIVFVYSRNSLPGSNNIKKALVLTGIMFVVLFVIPTLKYPANPPAVGNPDTIYYRESLYVGFIVISGFTSLAVALLYVKKIVKNINRPSKSIGNIAIPVFLYVVIMGSAYILFPPNPDKITIPMDLIMTFRVAGAFTIGIFWGLMAITLGSFWDILKPHETRKIASV
ncbi:MAG TPA: CbtA family protein [Candidatus Nitrosopolaris sp.]|nr:CbtA family protein [Candidatus Nitrosopolaris sp.]